MRNYFNALIFFIISAYTCVGQPFPKHLTEKHQQIAGTNIYMIPPPAFEGSESYKGFHNPTNPTAMIMVMEIPGPYQMVISGFNESALEKRGMNLNYKHAVSISAYDGLSINLEQEANGLLFSKYILIYGDSTATTMINGVFPKDSTLLGEAIKASVMSTYINSEIIANPRAALNYSVEESLGNLQFKNVMGNAMMFNRDLKIPTESPDKASLIIDKSFANTNIENKKLFCVSRIKKFPTDYSLITDKGINEIEIDGIQGYEIYAKNNADESEEAYQVILFDDSVGYYIFFGTYLKGSNQALTDIKRVINSFKRK